MTTTADKPNELGILAAVLAIVGVLGPWATATTRAGDFVMDANPKTRVIIIGGAVIVGLWSMYGGEGLEVALVAGVIGVVVRVITAWIDVNQAADAYPRANLGHGWGLWTCGAAGVAAATAVLVQLGRRQ